MEAIVLKIFLISYRCKHYKNTGKLEQSTAATKLPSYCPSLLMVHS